MDVQIRLLEGFQPTSLPPGQVALSGEVFEVEVVGVDAELGALQVATPCAKSMDHCQQFQLVYGIVALGGVELARLVGDGLKSTALVLEQRGADGKLGGVCVELKWVGKVRCCQDWCQLSHRKTSLPLSD